MHHAKGLMISLLYEGGDEALFEEINITVLNFKWLLEGEVYLCTKYLWSLCGKYFLKRLIVEINLKKV